MLEHLTLWQKVRIWLSDFSVMERPLLWLDGIIERFGKIKEHLHDALFEYVIYLRYILWLFALTIAFILLKIIYKWLIGRFRVSFFESSEGLRMHFWHKYMDLDEKQELDEVKEVFKQAKEIKAKPNLENGISFDLFRQIASAVGEGLSDSQIVKLLPAKLALIDVLPIIESIRFFRDMVAQQVLSETSSNKRDWLFALKELSDGRPYKAVNLIHSQLVLKQKILFNLKDKLLQQYTKKEASALSLHMALMVGVYDVHLADKAYRRAMELNPKSKRSAILFGRFRQQAFGMNDKAAEQAFLNMANKIDNTLQNYMIEYANKTIQKAQMRARLNELRKRYLDERERYHAAIQIERLKVREQLKLAQMQTLAQEARLRSLD